MHGPTSTDKDCLGTAPRCGYKPVPISNTVQRIGTDIRVQTFDSLRYRDFRILITATIIASSGKSINQVVLGWLTYDITHSPLLTTLAFTMGSLPVLFFGPFAGVLVDRWDRTKLLSLGFGASAVGTMVLGVIVTWGEVHAWHIIAFVTANGMGIALYEPIRSALIPSIVPRHMLVNAFALRSLAGNVTTIGVPTLVGIVMTWFGPGLTLLLGVPLHLAGSVAALAIKAGKMVSTTSGSHSVFGDLAEGSRYVRTESPVLAVLFLTALPMILGYPFVSALMPVYASEVFAVGPTGLGLLMSALGAGAVVGAFTMASLGEVHHKSRWIIYGLGIAILSMLLFSRASDIKLALPLLIMFTLGLGILTTMSGAFVQSMVPDRLRGRVTSLISVSGGLYPFGALLSGGMTELLGAPTSTLLATIPLSIVSLMVALKFKQVWQSS